MAEKRIDRKMTVIEATRVLCENDLRSYSICMMMLRLGAQIDPDNAHEGGLTNLLDLDRHGIYGNRIWKFYVYVCGKNIGKMIAVLRAEQFGQLAGVTTEVLNHAIDNYGEGINIEAVIAAVENEFPNFNIDAASTN